MSAPTGKWNVNPKHSSWLDERTAGGAAAWHPTMKWASRQRSAGRGRGRGKGGGWWVGGGGWLSRWHCGCSLTETNSRALRPGMNNPGVHAMSVRALSVCECCMCALACIKRQTEVVRVCVCARACMSECAG